MFDTERGPAESGVVVNRDAEAAVRGRCEAGDWEGAVNETLRLLGSELFGYLVALHHDENDAGDAFARCSERLWRGLPRFQWECSLRTWAYRLARSASVDQFRAEGAVARRAVPLSDCPEVAAMVARVRSETSPYLRTGSRDVIANLRRSLPETDQTLLILRLDKKLAFSEIARVFAEGGADAETIARESARLRKRFQLARERLLALGRQHGLLPRKVG